MYCFLALVVVMLAIVNPAYAKWPTSVWTVLNDNEQGAKEPNNWRHTAYLRYIFEQPSPHAIQNQ